VSTFRVVGPGRAGLSLAAALEAVGHRPEGMVGRGEPLRHAARGVDLLVIATPDDAVAEVAELIVPVAATVVLHLSGSLTLDVLSPHPRRASLHPLVPLPSPAVGSARLLSGITFAVSGDSIARQLAEDLGGRAVEVEDGQRAAYHAAAAIAANHLVALLGQVERVGAAAGLPLDAFAGLVHAATEDAFALGPRDALTGPASRGDWRTIETHRQVLAGLPAPRTEIAAYDALVGLARRLRMDTADGEGASAVGSEAPSSGRDDADADLVPVDASAQVA
jgi:predicted short-subunit dehydrogenase-like oxidoreductase (DUF2520 family)